jgi:hypothetical protein
MRISVASRLDRPRLLALLTLDGRPSPRCGRLWL